MPDETQNPAYDATGDAAAADAAVGGAAVGEDEYNPPNTMIERTGPGEESVHIFSETGEDDAIVKPSGEIVPRVKDRLDEYIEKQDVVGGGGEAPDDVAEADGDFFDGTF